MLRLGSHLSQMTGLPPEEKLKPRLEVDLSSSGALKRARRRAGDKKKGTAAVERIEPPVKEAGVGLWRAGPCDVEALSAERQSPVEETGGELAIGLAQTHNHAAQGGAERQSPAEETGGKFAIGLTQAHNHTAQGAERQSPVEETGGKFAIGLAQAHNHTAQGAERQSPVEETGGKFATGRGGEPEVPMEVGSAEETRASRA